MRSLQIKFAGVGALETANVSCELHHRHLHAQADSKKRYLVFPRIPNSGNFSLGAAIAETAGNQNAVDLLEDGLSAFLFDLFRFDAVEIDLNFIGNAAVDKRL